MYRCLATRPKAEAGIKHVGRRRERAAGRGWQSRALNELPCRCRQGEARVNQREQPGQRERASGASAQLAKFWGCKIRIMLNY